jgi:hypothetical protein
MKPFLSLVFITLFKGYTVLAQQNLEGIIKNNQGEPLQAATCL